MGPRRLSGLLFLLAKMVDIGSASSLGDDDAHVVTGSLKARFEPPSTEWVEQALAIIAGEPQVAPEPLTVGPADAS